MPPTSSPVLPASSEYSWRIDKCQPSAPGRWFSASSNSKPIARFALLGLPEAQRLSPSIAASERRLVEVTEQMRHAGDLATNNKLLDELTALAAEVEAGAAASVFRFGASRAYEEIVEQRLQTIGERKVGGLPTWSSFLARRMKPALRTCVTTEARQSSLSLKLARAANLLRTRVDVELEQQNQELLKSMNARTRLQLRLQATVEGLSVAAITYYVVSLFGYLAKAAHESGSVAVDPSILTAAFVPLAGPFDLVDRSSHSQKAYRGRSVIRIAGTTMPAGRRAWPRCRRRDGVDHDRHGTI